MRSRRGLVRSELGRGGEEVRAGPDARPVPQQGPARLGGVRAAARRALRQGASADHARRADEKALALRAHRCDAQDQCPHPHHHGRRGRSVPRAGAPHEAPYPDRRAGRSALVRPYDQPRGAGAFQPRAARVLPACRRGPRRPARSALARHRHPRLRPEVILVTGGAGFVGLNVVEQLAARGERVAVYDLSVPRIDVPAELGDVTDVQALERAFAKHRPAAVIHLAAITAGRERDAREPGRIAEVNLIGTINVLAAARRHAVQRFVHASTGAVYGTAGIGAREPLDEERDRAVPESMYGITKYAAERSCLRLGELWQMDVRVGRLATAFGRWEHATSARDRLSPPTEIARMARRGGEAVFPPLGATDYIYAPDLASALLALLDALDAAPSALPPRHRRLLGVAPEWCELLAPRCPGFRWRE